MKKVMIYPYTEEMIPIIRHSKLLNDTQITSLVSLKGNSLLNDKYCIGDEQLLVSEDFESELENCDCLLLGKLMDVENGSVYDNHTEDIIISNLQKAVELNKKVIFFNNIYSKSNKIKKFIPKKQQIEILNKSQLKDSSSNCIYSINTPVIFVCSLLEGLDKFNVQLAIRDNLLSKGYNILQIGSRQNCELFNFFSYPEFMYSNEIKEKDKVIMFNNFVKQKEVKYNPDIIIIGIPGGVMQFSSQAVGDFGLTMFKVNQSLSPDSTILCLPFRKYSDSDIASYENMLRQKFNIDVDYVNIVPKSVIKDATERKNTPMYLTLDNQFVENQLIQLSKSNVFSFSNEDSVDQVVNDIICQFTKYGSINYL